MQRDRTADRIRPYLARGRTPHQGHERNQAELFDAGDDGLLYLVAPDALDPIAENGEILTGEGIGLDGLEVPIDGTADLDPGLDATGELWS